MVIIVLEGCTRGLSRGPGAVLTITVACRDCAGTKVALLMGDRAFVSEVAGQSAVEALLVVRTIDLFVVSPSGLAYPTVPSSVLRVIGVMLRRERDENVPPIEDLVAVRWSGSCTNTGDCLPS